MAAPILLLSLVIFSASISPTVSMVIIVCTCMRDVGSRRNVRNLDVPMYILSKVRVFVMYA